MALIRKPPTTPSEFRLKAVLERAGLKVWHNKLCFGYYPDFWVQGTKVLIEVDGKYHNTPEQKEKDKRRSKILRSYGFKIIRCTNYQVEKNPAKIVSSVKDEIVKQRAKNKAKISS